MKIILTGGGSAGHVMPCIALLPCLREYFSDICYLGRADGIERRLAEMNGIKFHPVNAVKFDRSSKLSVLKIPCSLSRAVSQTKKLLKELRPDVLFAKGGYVSLPGALAARSLKIPVVCHESDFSLGLANKVISRFAECILTSFEATAAKRSLFVGNPVRAELTQADPQKARRTCAFSRTARVVLFVGGSGGAETINRAVDDALSTLVRDFNVVHICGQGNLRPSAPGYRCFEFVDDIFDFFALADIVVTRAGANAGFELAAMGKRTIFIPLPTGSSRGDQIENAKAFASVSGAKVLEQSRLDTYELVCAITDSLSRPSPEPDLRPLKAAPKIAEILNKVARREKFA